jgi:DNA-binding GntR family transcriptional regulator
MRAAGLEVTTRLIKSEVVEAYEAVAKALRTPESTPVVRIERVRYLRGTPFALQVAYLPRKYGDEVRRYDLETGSLSGILQELMGKRFARATESVGARGATVEEARALASRSGFPVLTVHGVTYDSSGEPIRYTESVYRSDLVSLQSTHSRNGEADA